MCPTDRLPISGFGFSRAGKSKLLLLPLLLLLAACGGQMANQPRYEPYEPSDFFADGSANRHLVDGTVARGYVQNDPLLYTGRMDVEAPAITDEAGTSDPSSSSGQEGGDEPTGQEGASQPAEGDTPSDALSGEGESAPGGNAAQAQQGELATVYPFPVTPDVLERGQERYNIYCTPCHGRLGEGDGMIVRRGYPQPPSLHIERLREAPPGHFFDVITNGWGVMPPYEGMVPVVDRWAIAAYIQVLQRSQNATLDDVPPEALEALQNPPAEAGTEGEHEANGEEAP